MSPAAIPWHEANQSSLMAALSEVRLALEKLLPDAPVAVDAANPANAAGAADDAASPANSDDAADDAASAAAQAKAAPAPLAPAASAAPGAPIASIASEWTLPMPAALDTVCSSFELSTFERKILLMCAGAEMDARFSALFSALHGDARRTQATFSLALAAFEDAHWSAIAPARPLRRWHLIETGNGDALTTSPLRISGRVLHFLAGVNSIDERLEPLVKPWPAAQHLVASHHAVAAKVAAAWSQADGRSAIPIVQLCGNEPEGKRNIAAAAAALVGLELHTVSARNIAPAAAEIDMFLRLWQREAVLSSSALLLEIDDDSADPSHAAAISALMESIRGALIVSTPTPRRSAFRPVILFDVGRPTRAEQSAIWTNALGPSASSVNGAVESMVSQFQLSSASIRSAASQALGGAVPRSHRARSRRAKSIEAGEDVAKANPSKVGAIVPATPLLN